MLRNRKASIVTELLTIESKYKGCYPGYYLLDSNCVNECHKYLIDSNGTKYTILEHGEVSAPVLNKNILFNGWSEKTFSCVKLDNQVEIGTFLYVYYEHF